MSGRFTYWVHRIARGGDVLAPEPRDQPVQLIHARDLADWLLDMAEKGESGVFNATGPERPLTMEAVLEAIVDETGSDARLVWVDEDYLVENGVEAWSDLPLWVAPGGNPEVANFLAIDVSKAIGAGLRFRPLAETIRDTLEQAETFPQAGLDEARGAGAARAMSAVALDVAAVRARFSALDRPLAFLDAPGGTQTPDSVIEAMAGTCASRTRTSAGRSRRACAATPSSSPRTTRPRAFSAARRTRSGSART